MQDSSSYQADRSCDDWLEDASTIDETDATKIEIPAEQGSKLTLHPLHNSTDHREQFENHKGTLTQTTEL